MVRSSRAMPSWWVAESQAPPSISCKVPRWKLMTPWSSTCAGTDRMWCGSGSRGARRVNRMMPPSRAARSMTRPMWMPKPTMSKTPSMASA